MSEFSPGSGPVNLRTYTSLGDLLDASVDAFGPQPFIEYQGRYISYRKLSDYVDRCAYLLSHLGFSRGDRLGLYFPNTPFHPILLFAAAKLGGVCVHLTPLDADQEIEFKCRDAGIRFLATLKAEPLLGRARAVSQRCGLQALLVADDALWSDEPSKPLDIDMPYVSINAAIERAGGPDPAYPDIGPEDLALIQYTGGTTGEPKGALLTHGNLTSAVHCYNAAMAGQSYWGAPGERHLGLLPLFHIYALSAILLRAMASGDTIHLRKEFSAQDVLADIETYRITWFFAVPTLLIGLMEHPDFLTRDLSSLKLCVSGGAPLPAEIARRFGTLTGRAVNIGWGMTETCGAGTLSPNSGEAAAGEIGRPLPGIDIRIVDADDSARELGRGEIGEICIRGPNVMKGYHNQPGATQAAFRDGFLLTGDIGVLDASGCLSLLDRKKDLIISSGYNVYPRHVEEAIYQHPGVEEVIVYGVPDAYRGEAAKAAIKLKSGTGTFTLGALRDFLSDKLGRHELPAQLEFVDSVPRTAAGKFSKRELRGRDSGTG